MSRWYRAYEGTVTDGKLAEVALVAGCSRSVAIATWHAILESAASVNDGGRIDTSPRRVAAILGEPLACIEAVFSEMESLGMVEDGAVCAWAKRQFVSDNSTERSRKHRQAKRNDNATLQQQDATPSYTETDTDNGGGTKARGMRARLVSAMGPLAWCAERHSKFHVLSEPVYWITSGCDLEADILPAIKAKCLSMQQRGDEPRGWKIFEQAVFEARDRRLAPPPPVQQRAASPPQRSNGRQDPFAAMERIAARERQKAEIDSRAVEFVPADRG